MDAIIREALTRSQVIDITTTGRVSGEPRRIEIFFHAFDGRIYISGMPNPSHVRAWIRNLEADPKLTFHLTKGPVADLPATARVISDPAERHEIMPRVAQAWRRKDAEVMEAYSPLIEVVIDGYEADRAA